MRVLQLTYRASGLGALACLAVLVNGSVALAQAPTAEPPVIQPLPAEPAPPPPPVQGEFVPPPPMAPPPSEEPAAEEPAGLKISAFADAFYGFQTAAQGTPSPFHRAYDSNTFVSTDDYTGGAAQNGFGLSFAGVDASYDGGQLGATISLRAGPSVTIFYGGDQGLLGIDNITQAFATWTPAKQLSIDIGQFNTIFGAEVAESWHNLNYTRGGLYYAMQPFWHTGLRATVSPNEKVRITGMVVNGVNSARDDNETPSLALQLGVTPSDLFALSAGWLTTLNPSTDGQVFDNFFDLVMSLTVERFTLIFNADLSVMGDKKNVGEGYEQSLDNPMFWGLSLAAGYQATDIFGLALRGELLSDADNQLYKATTTYNGVTFPTTQQTNVVTVTGTLDFKPVKGSNNLVIRWDNRIETSNEEIFYNRSESETNVWFESILGVVVSTDG
ncbi:MAG TPA: porin [Polyangiaceae bacterium]|nr:porin [Polyangiaceae bacterium]